MKGDFSRGHQPDKKSSASTTWTIVIIIVVIAAAAYLKLGDIKGESIDKDTNPQNEVELTDTQDPEDTSHTPEFTDLNTNDPGTTGANDDYMDDQPPSGSQNGSSLSSNEKDLCPTLSPPDIEDGCTASPIYDDENVCVTGYDVQCDNSNERSAPQP